MENKLSESYKEEIKKLFNMVFYDGHTDKTVNINLSNLDMSECKTENDMLDVIIDESYKQIDEYRYKNLDSYDLNHVTTLFYDNWSAVKSALELKKLKNINIFSNKDKDLENTFVRKITEEEREKATPMTDRRINLTNDKPEQMNTPMPLEDAINIMKENGYKNIHISGPISNLGREKAKIQFDAISHMLKAYGFTCTHTFSFLSSDKMTKQYYLKESIRSMLDKDAVVRFNLNIPSEGAKIEEEICDLVKIPHFNIPVNFNK